MTQFNTKLNRISLTVPLLI